ncbi:unnamed protein product [Strongylus vulgaris]|uniref:Uncharacterized protein n=1 Tax=Strongylus vulgaris TaxID=40348 RepID=A0A3P7JX59_STRVU|nr:unnamed protein product [Strongylus vulgaris]
MCSYEVRGACVFPDTAPPIYHVYIMDHVPATHMCSYEVRGACVFPDTAPPIYHVYIMDHVIRKRMLNRVPTHFSPFLYAIHGV